MMRVTKNYNTQPTRAVMVVSIRTLCSMCWQKPVPIYACVTVVKGRGLIQLTTPGQSTTAFEEFDFQLVQVLVSNIALVPSGTHA